MSLLLKLDSSLVSQGSGDFTVQYGQALRLANINTNEWDVALIKAFLWYSYHNVSSNYGNNIIRYSLDSGATWEANIIIPNGIYSVSDINTYMQAEMATRGHFGSGTGPGGIDEYYITLAPNFNTLKVEVTLVGLYQIDFSAGSINELLGFNSVVITSSQSASNPADITRGVNALQINTSITESGWSNEFSGNTLFTFIPDSAPGSNIQVTPNPAIYLPINTHLIERIRMWVTDQNNRPISFEGENVTYLLHLRKRLGS